MNFYKKLSPYIFFLYFVGFSSVFSSLPEKEELVLSAKEKILIEHVKKSIAKANSGISNLPQDVLNIPGLSSPKVRHLLNNLCSLQGTCYLEIGCWKGSTWIAALYGNEKELSSATAIDDWSLFGGPKEEFLQHCALFLPNMEYSFISNDAFKIDVDTVFTKPISIYFYDGDHSKEAQEKAFTYFDSIFDDVFIAIVDDYNWDRVVRGTQSAFKKLNYTVLFDTVLPAKANKDHKNWWNGLYVAVIRKAIQ